MATKTMVKDLSRTQTGVVVVVCAVFAVLCAIPGFFYLVFARLAAVQFLTAGAILGTTILIYIQLWFIEFCLKRYHVKNEVDVFQRIQNRLLVGMGTVTMGTLPIRIAAFYMEEPSWILIYSLFTTLISILLAGHFFFYPIRKMCKTTDSIESRTSWLILAVNLIAWIVAIRLSIDYSDEILELTKEEKIEKSNIRFLRLLPQIVFPMLSTASTVEFSKIWNGEFELLEDAWNILALESGREVVERAPENDGMQNVLRRLAYARELLDQRMNRRFGGEAPTLHPPKSNGIECKICLHEYSQTRIPRILRECGHTICEECANKLLEKNRGKTLFCPFCQNGTAVNGPASRLAKNYTVLDILDYMKKEN